MGPWTCKIAAYSDRTLNQSITVPERKRDEPSVDEVQEPRGNPCCGRGAGKITPRLIDRFLRISRRSAAIYQLARRTARVEGGGRPPGVVLPYVRPVYQRSWCPAAIVQGR